MLRGAPMDAKKAPHLLEKQNNPRKSLNFFFSPLKFKMRNWMSMMNARDLDVCQMPKRVVFTITPTNRDNNRSATRESRPPFVRLIFFSFVVVVVVVVDAAL